MDDFQVVLYRSEDLEKSEFSVRRFGYASVAQPYCQQSQLVLFLRERETFSYLKPANYFQNSLFYLTPIQSDTCSEHSDISSNIFS
jgi:hypothetical protein